MLVTKSLHKTAYTWQDYAHAASIEQDPKKLIELINKLTQALDEDRQRKHPMRIPTQ